jgi:hypothetical protein
MTLLMESIKSPATIEWEREVGEPEGERKRTRGVPPRTSVPRAASPLGVAVRESVSDLEVKR